VKNLFIVDGSIWVTSGGVNPTSTIQALALYIATPSRSAWQRYLTELMLAQVLVVGRSMSLPVAN